MRSFAFGLCLALGMVSAAGVARAEDDSSKGKSHFTVAFSGGMLAPVRDMADRYDSSLDVIARFGWTASSGFGLVANLEYSPIRRVDEGTFEFDSHLVTATAAPRFTLGHKTFRMWVAAGGGVVIERVRATDSITAISDTQVDSIAAFNGSVGIDLHVFTNGGLSLSGAYTKSFSDTKVYDYFSLAAGLVFTL